MHTSLTFDWLAKPFAAVGETFPDGAWEALLGRGQSVTVLWNPGCETPQPTHIDLRRLDECPPLLPMAE